MNALCNLVLKSSKDHHDLINCFSNIMPEIYGLCKERIMKMQLIDAMAHTIFARMIKFTLKIVNLKWYVIQDMVLDFIMWTIHCGVYINHWSVPDITAYLELLKAVLMKIEASSKVALCISSSIPVFLMHSSIEIQWLAMELLGIVLKINDLEWLLKSHFPVDFKQIINMRMPLDVPEYSNCIAPLSAEDNASSLDAVSSRKPWHLFRGFHDSGKFCPLFGVLLHSATGSQSFFQLSYELGFMLTPSRLQNLESLTYAFASGSPALIVGPAACGKTALLEYFAALFCRKRSSDIVRLQLGDQTDSKVR